MVEEFDGDGVIFGEVVIFTVSQLPPNEEVLFSKFPIIIFSVKFACAATILWGKKSHEHPNLASRAS